MTKRILLTVAVLSLPALTHAQELSRENGVYVAANVAQAKYDDGLINDQTTARSINVGYRLLDGAVAVELARTEADFSNRGFGLDTEANTVRALWRGLRRDSISVLLGAGYHDIDYTLSLSGVDIGSDSDTATSAIVGLEIDTATVFTRLAVEKLFGLRDDGDARLITVGVGYRF